MARSFRFAVQSFNADSARQWSERALRAEDLGYSTLQLADHLLVGDSVMEDFAPVVARLAGR